MAVSVAAAALLGLFLPALAPAVLARHDAWRAMQLSRPKTPTQAPPFVLEDLRGRRVGLAELRGRAVILYFWATW